MFSFRNPQPKCVGFHGLPVNANQDFASSSPILEFYKMYFSDTDLERELHFLTSPQKVREREY